MLRFFGYFGAKTRAARLYPAPRYPLVVEPFAGSAGYSVHWAPRCTLLNDLDKRVVALWQWLIAASPEDVLALPLIEPGQRVADLDCREGGKLLISCWLSRHPWARACTLGWARRAIGAEADDTRWWGPGRRAIIAQQVEVINSWEARRSDYDELPDIEATWFIDPPYQHLGKSYRHNAIDYARLAEWCRSRRGQVIVCEQEGADWLPFEPFANTYGVAVKSRMSRSNEVWWTNEPHETQLVLPEVCCA